MPRDVIISCFASDKKGQPLELFEDAPVRVEVNGVGSDTYKASFDSDRKPREPWGGKPFSREAEMYRARGGGSIIQGLLKAQASGVEPRRVAVIGFSAGNTFLSAILKNEFDASLIDTLISIDGMTYPKDYKGSPIGFDHWVAFARRATGMDRMTSADNPYKGPLMVVSHTKIASASPSQVSTTREAARHLFWRVNDAYWDAASKVPRATMDDQAKKQQEVIARLRAASSRIELPLSIKGGNPPTTKTWSSAPWPVEVGYLGNLWGLDWGGTGGPDHIFQATVCQHMLWEAYLAPRWNARSPSVAGLGGYFGSGGGIRLGAVEWTSPESRPGGGIIDAGTLSTGIPRWLIAAGAGLVGFWGGATLVEKV